MVRINDELEIPDDELRFTFSRSSGPGGQNVNKVETRVTLAFDVAGSPSLTDEQKRRLSEVLGNRMTGEGVLLLSSQRSRSRAANQRDTVARFAELLAAALEPETPRVPTKVPRRARKRRLESKRRRARVKALRQPPED